MTSWAAMYSISSGPGRRRSAGTTTRHPPCPKARTNSQNDTSKLGDVYCRPRVRARDPDESACAGDQLGHPGVGNDDALGPPGRPRRVDDVGRMLREQRRAPVGVREVAGRESGQPGDGGRVVERRSSDGPAAALRGGTCPRLAHAWPVANEREFASWTARLGGRDNGDRGGVGDHEGKAVGGVGGVEGEVGGAGLHDGQQRDDQIDGAGQGDGDHRLGAGAGGDEEAGEAVGPFVAAPR